jgi:Zn-dependent M16 (insulinase) family peptidase
MHQFELHRQETIAELQTEAYLYKHASGAELLSLVNDDENKVFGITFRTPPSDSTGIAHILEHSVLCGSRKYPVKEPFVELLKGSLNTFLNAFTYPDKTCYPVASQNLQDFYNLVDVYLDAVFYPRLTPEVLQQEGWHYELDDPEKPLTFKGVVYNEMKGAYSDPDRRLGEYAQHSIFPDTTYGVESGGHPRHIPDLTWEQFETFHRELYHPANSRIYVYGDDDPKRRLELLEEYLGDFEPRNISSQVKKQPRFDEPRRMVERYPVSADGENNKSMTTVSWLLHDDPDAETIMALHILEHILLGTPASPLRKVLIESGLGEDLAGVGMESELMQIYFSVGLRGVEPTRVNEVEELILETLETLANEGFDPDTVAAALNTAEFRLRENNTGSYPRGLALMLRALSSWLYDRDPLEPLKFETPLGSIKAKSAPGNGFFEQMIRSQLLSNRHRTTIVLEPDADLAAAEEREESERLAQARAGMDAKELQAHVANTLELRRLQETPDAPEDLAKLPRLQLKDLERTTRKIPMEMGSENGLTTLYHDLFTNGIVYLDVGFDLHVLPAELLPYVPLFGRALLETGTEREDFVKLDQRIGMKTGGIGSHALISSKRNGSQAAAWLFLRGKGMTNQVAELLEIMQEVLATARLDDRERFVRMVLEEKAGEEASLVPGGHRVANLRLRAQYDEASWASEQMKGVEYLFFLRQLMEDCEERWDEVHGRLEELRRRLVNRRSMILNGTYHSSDRAEVEKELAQFAARIPESDTDSTAWSPRYVARNEGLAVPSQVNYVAKAANIYDLGYELDGSVGVITRFMGTSWLWDRVRVQGGAYGAFCSFDHFSGVLSYASYRDPNLLETVEVYDQTSRFLAETEINEDELHKAIIGTIGDLDGYQLPDAKGYTSMVRHLAGVTEEYRQTMRDQVLGTEVAAFREFAQVLEQLNEEGRVVVLGAADKLEAANQERPDFLEIVKVL